MSTGEVAVGGVRKVIADFVRSCREDDGDRRTVQMFDVLADNISGRRPDAELESQLAALNSVSPLALAAVVERLKQAQEALEYPPLVDTARYCVDDALALLTPEART